MIEMWSEPCTTWGCALGYFLIGVIYGVGVLAATSALYWMSQWDEY